MKVMTPILTAARAIQPRTVELRRTLHSAPEIGLQLPKTQASVLTALDGLPLEIVTGRATGSVTAVLRGDRPGPTVLLRGDMDALPLTEDTGLDFASTLPGTMHACGHDTHTAMLASAAHLLCDRRAELAGQVVFMFQPGEEGYHGARYMIDEGVLDAAGRRVDKALALHITSTLRSGLLHVRSGPVMASADVLRVTVTGSGGHASSPHTAVDPIPAAAAMVSALQTMITRRISVFAPAVITIARISAGTTNNIIPETAELEGTLRTLSEDSRELALREVRTVCEHVAAAHGCQASVEVEPGYPVTVNDDAVAQEVVELGRSVLGADDAEAQPNPLMGAEDFSYVLQEVPGVMAFLGACPPDLEPDSAPANHSNRVLFHEEAMASGVAIYTAFAVQQLARPL
ncbi:amidohydrolase [Pseudonocardiaceae bacterium YIM PH 21723]|nr:amidohydrolase [Pseudonocardiaceae bacterium YIM PH 21723]